MYSIGLRNVCDKLWTAASAASEKLRQRLVFHCLATSASTAPRKPRRMCLPYAYVLITVLRVSRSCELFPDGFDLYLLQCTSHARKDVLP